MKIGDRWISKTFLVLIVISIISFAVIITHTDMFYPTGPATIPNPHIQFGDKQYHLELALTEAEQEQGLGGRQSLDKNSAMLFVFKNEDYWGIWMKDMQFPIDVIWLDSSYRVVGLRSNMLPVSYPDTIYKPDAPARYVIEANPGFIDDNNIIFGSKLSIIL